MVFSGGPTLGETKKDQESKKVGRQDERWEGKNKATVTGQHGGWWLFRVGKPKHDLYHKHHHFDCTWIAKLNGTITTYIEYIIGL